MFRRKEEDSLFDTNAEGAPVNETAEETVTVITPQSAAATPASSAYTPAAPAQPVRQMPEARPNATAATNSFRSSAAPISGDMARNRMPEAKPAAASAPIPAPIGAPVASVASTANKPSPRILTVGADILLKGEIATCDRLVIEGKVDATLNDVHTVEIAESGSFKGAAQIENAEISGLFEGDLTVRGRLVIYATGTVRGKITYGEIEIQRGGELSGEIKNAGAATSASSRPAARPAAAPAKETLAA